MDDNSIYLGGPIVSKNAEQRIVTAPVLVPGEKDSDGEVVTEQDIERVSLKFMESYGNVDVGHTFNNVAVPVESWIARSALKFQLSNGDSLDIPKGSWMMSSKVGNDQVWQGVLSGKFKGYSIAGIKLAEVEQAMKSADVTAEEFFGAALKRKTLLRDLGSDWIAIAVSIVEDPSVFKSKWVAIKSTAAENPLQRLLNRFSNKTKEKNSKEDSKMDEKKLIAAMKEAAVEAVTEVVEEKVMPRLQAVEDKIPEAAAEEKPAEQKTEEKSEDTSGTEEKSNVIDLSDQIGEVQEQLLKELQADEPDTEKITKLNAKLDALKEISEGDKEEKPKDMQAMQKQIDELKAKLDGKDDKDKDGKPATKSRADKGQDGGGSGDRDYFETADKDSDDGLPDRDAHGCVKRKRA
jgi:hypothetical protein